MLCCSSSRWLRLGWTHMQLMLRHFVLEVRCTDSNSCIPQAKAFAHAVFPFFVLRSAEARAGCLWAGPGEVGRERAAAVWLTRQLPGENVGANCSENAAGIAVGIVAKSAAGDAMGRATGSAVGTTATVAWREEDTAAAAGVQDWSPAASSVCQQLSSQQLSCNCGSRDGSSSCC